MSMDRTEAEELVRRMYGAHGVRPDAQAVTELAIRMIRADCATCARKVLETNADEGKRPLTVPTFNGAFFAALSSVEHGLHVNQDDREVHAGDIEGFWRDKGLKVVREVLELDREEGTYVALSAWWGGIDPDVGALREQLIDPSGKPATWAIAALMYVRNCADPKAQTERLRRACRKAATSGIESLDPAELP